MKAIVQSQYGAAGVLRLEEIERPQVKPDEVLIRVHAAGVDPGVWHLMAGIPYVVRLAIGLRRPRNPIRGLDVAGVIEAVGAQVTTLKVGDEVFGVCEGAFAEFARASPKQLALKPAGLSFEAAASVPVSATTALQALRAGKVHAGQKVLIIGAGGGVGSFAVQLACAMGAEVTGVCSTSKVDFVRTLGAKRVIDYTRERFGHEQYDVILDAAGSRPLAELRKSITERGALIIVGGEGGGQWFGLGRQLQAMLVGLFSGQTFRSVISLVNQPDLLELKRYIDNGELKPVVSRVYSLSEVPQAIAALSAWKSQGKTVIQVS